MCRMNGEASSVWLISVVQGDHFIANRNPVAFNDAVERFLKEVG